MPFKNEKQRRYLYARKPRVAKRFAEHEHNSRTKRKRLSGKSLRDKRTLAERFSGG